MNTFLKKVKNPHGLTVKGKLNKINRWLVCQYRSKDTTLYEKISHCLGSSKSFLNELIFKLKNV